MRAATQNSWTGALRDDTNNNLRSGRPSSLRHLIAGYIDDGILFVPKYFQDHALYRLFHVAVVVNFCFVLLLLFFSKHSPVTWQFQFLADIPQKVANKTRQDKTEQDIY